MNESETKLIKDLFKELDEFPKLLKVLLIVLILVGAGSGFLIYHLSANLSDNQDQLKSLDSLLILFSMIFVFCSLVALVICIGYPIRQIYKKKKYGNAQGADALELKDDQELGQELTAYIIEQGNKKGNLNRDKKFIDINKNVTKTYRVLGTALTSLSGQEGLLTAMADSGIKIRLCAMNPQMAVDDICMREIENKSCYFVENWQIIQKLDIDAEHIAQILELEDIEKGTLQCQKNHLLDLMHMLIEQDHMKEYYPTSLDYKSRMQTARRDLNIIREKIVKNNGKSAMEIRDADSFIPISMTIADEAEEKGEMIVEFHLPFTDNKIMFFVNKKENEKLFQTFLDFYDTVWERAGNE